MLYDDDDEEEQEQFQWAIVSDPLSLSLWVLARDTSAFDSKYKDEVMTILKQRGFGMWWNKPVCIGFSPSLSLSVWR